MNALTLGAVANVLDRELWAEVPFGFWAVVFFVFGCIVGSFLNVCIHRMPRGQSLSRPPSHCPHCQYSIPWYLNVPLLTWVWLRGRCAHCKAPISPRYLLVELLTGLLFLGAWCSGGALSAAVALCYCLFLAGLVVATFIDFEHYIIPDEITLGGIGAGWVLSALVPQLHDVDRVWPALQRSAIGAAVGWGITYAVLRLGKLMFGRQKIGLEPGTKVRFTEEGVVMDAEETPYEDIFYRPSDEITLDAHTVEALGRRWENVPVRLSPTRLLIAEESFDPEKVAEVVVTTDAIVFPREAMGFGDVKFMGAIGAFLGWQGAVFTLMASSVVGAGVGLLLIALRKREWSARLPYGPYLAVAACAWVMGAKHWAARWLP